MTDLLLEVINHIVSAQLANAKDVDIFKDYSPSSPDSCVIVYEYQGSAPAPFTDISVRSVQIVARAKNSQEAKAKAWSIYHIFHAEDNLITLNNQVRIIACRNTPIKIGVDELNRYLYAFNLGITTNFD